MNQHAFLPSKQSSLSLFFLLLLLFAVCAPNAYAQAQEKMSPDSVSNVDPGAELWRAIRHREGESTNVGISQVRSVDSGVLINANGEKWAFFRMEQLKKYGPYPLLIIPAIILVFFLYRGRVGVDGGFSGEMVQRYTRYERYVHWIMAITFLVLAVTGLVLLFGRTALIPLFGKEGFSALAVASKTAHNWLGPLFAVSAIMMMSRFIGRNFYQKGDIEWVLKGGGYLGEGHAHAGFFSAGEKIWFWIFTLGGLALIASGLILLFPQFGQSRVIMEYSHMAHGIGAIAVLAVSFGHMYLGSIGTEGSIEAMKSGYVDIRWADSHHDLWGQECHDNNAVITADEFKRRTGKEAVITDPDILAGSR